MSQNTNNISEDKQNQYYKELEELNITFDYRNYNIDKEESNNGAKYGYKKLKLLGYFFNLKNNGSGKYLSFAFLDDKIGIRFHIEYEEDDEFLTYDNICKILSEFKIDYNFEIHEYNDLMENGYFVQTYRKYYNMLLTTGFINMEVESKGTNACMFNWTDKFKCSRVNNITQTGKHLWCDSYSFTCKYVNNKCSCYFK